MSDFSPLTTTSLLGITTEILTGADYKEITITSNNYWQSSNTRLFEDDHGIVGLVIFETWQDLVEGWESAQESLVELLTQYISRSEPKAWDGYLVLMTPSSLSSEIEQEHIRYDIIRLRKIVASGEELIKRSDIEKVISPLLPLNSKLISEGHETVLSRLPQLLLDMGILELYTETLIEAFLSQEPLVESLEKIRRIE